MKKRLLLITFICILLSIITIKVQAANVVPSPQRVTIDGVEVNCEKYNIDGSNYFKLRDLAYLLNGTEAQFNVTYNSLTSMVVVVFDQPYTPNGSELITGIDNSATAVPSSQKIYIRGATRSGLSVYNIGGSNFFKLSELALLLDFYLDYDGSTNTAMIYTSPVDENGIARSGGIGISSLDDIEILSDDLATNIIADPGWEGVPPDWITREARGVPGWFIGPDGKSHYTLELNFDANGRPWQYDSLNNIVYLDEACWVGEDGSILINDSVGFVKKLQNDGTWLVLR